MQRPSIPHRSFLSLGHMVAALLGTVFVAEVAVMVLLPQLYGSGGILEAVMDAAVLTILIAPFFLIIGASGKRVEDQLTAQARQQAAVAQLGQRALAGGDPQTLMDEAVSLVGQTLGVEYCQVLELLPDGEALLLRAGHGWQEGYVGRARVGTDTDSQAGYTLLLRDPVIVEDLRTETRFSGAPLLHEHGVVSGMSVVIPGDERPFGVLGAHTTTRRMFGNDDVHFLQAVANVLATAIGRTRVEEALQRAERSIHTVLTGLPIVLWAWDRDGVLTFSEGKGLEHLELTPGEGVGRSVFEVYRDVPQLAEQARRALAGERFDSTIDMGGIWWDVRYRPVRDESGEVAGVLGAAIDMTERKQAEDAVRASEKRYRDLVDNSQGIICTHDLDGNLLSLNPAGARSLGYEPHELVGRTLRDVLAPSVGPQLAEYLERIRRDGIADGLMIVISKRGEERVWTYRNVLYAENGQPPYVIAHVQDMTESQRAKQALERSEAKYRALVEHASYGIYQSSTDGKFLAANPALVEMLGYESEEALLAVDLACDVYADCEERAVLLERYDIADRIDGLEVQWKRKDGSLITVRLSGRTVRDAAGDLEGFEMIAEDVTQRRVLEAQLRQAQKMEAVGQLTGGIAHDFNNILTAILGNAELVASDLPPEHADLRADVDQIHAAAQRGAALIKKLMAFSRQEQLQFEAVDVAQLCQDTTAMLRRILPENIDVRVVPQEIGHILADRGAVEQILINLATNARDAMPEGGVLHIDARRTWFDEQFRATHGWGKPGEYICLSVSDTGAGIDEDTQAKIFEPFFTTKPVGEGTGLGMAIIYGLVKQHNGFISVYSDVGEGTTVKIYFPVVRETNRAAPSQNVVGLRGGAETVLLAEDEEAVRRSGQRVLERYGYRVLTAADGEQALEVLEADGRKIDLVITDMVMPKLSGGSLHEKVGKREGGPKFIFASGYTGRDIRDSGELDPTVPFLHKPWTVTELVMQVREVLDGRTEFVADLEA